MGACSVRPMGTNGGAHHVFESICRFRTGDNDLTFRSPAISRDSLVPPFVTAEGRRNFVLLGRLNYYKNIDVCLQAWETHTPR